MDCEHFLCWSQISLSSKDLKLAGLITPTSMQESCSWDLEKDSTTTGHEYHAGKFQAFCAYTMQWVGTYREALSIWIKSAKLTPLLHEAKEHMYMMPIIARCIELPDRNMVSQEPLRKEELNYNHARLQDAVRMGSASERLGCEAEL